MGRRLSEAGLLKDSFQLIIPFIILDLQKFSQRFMRQVYYVRDINFVGSTKMNSEPFLRHSTASTALKHINQIRTLKASYSSAF